MNIGMEFNLNRTISILGNTPEILGSILHTVGEDWASIREGENTWSLIEVIAHLVVCEKTNWIPRIRIILSQCDTRMLVPINVDPQFDLARDHSMHHLLSDFSQQRKDSLREFKQLGIRVSDLQKTGTHPELGTVNLQQVLATWVTHDLSHTLQILRILAKQNKGYCVPLSLSFKAVSRLVFILSPSLASTR